MWFGTHIDTKFHYTCFLLISERPSTPHTLKPSTKPSKRWALMIDV
jgi:hypothetical protein